MLDQALKNIIFHDQGLSQKKITIKECKHSNKTKMAKSNVTQGITSPRYIGTKVQGVTICIVNSVVHFL